MSSSIEIIGRNLAAVRQRLEAACRRAGRKTSDVTLVGVTKYADFAWVQDLMALGVCHLGESRPQQLLARAAQIHQPVDWHLIGPLQRNKVRVALPAVSLIHSVDSLRLLEQIERVAEELDLRPRVLIEVNLIGDPKKHGFTEAELHDQWNQVTAVRHVQVAGLMAMAAWSDNPEHSRPTFARLRRLREDLAARSPANVPLTELSMGMTGDFEVAIEEGATLVRIGSALWESLSRGSG